MITTAYDYPFTEKQAEDAFNEWGCNCGPTALAFALQIGLDEVRHAIPEFDEKRYTSPTMMKAALANLGKTFRQGAKTINGMFATDIAIVRIQWTGPWTAPGANPKWAYHQTHWIAAWETDLVFDCNGGIRRLPSWEKEVVPALLAQNKRADGGWLPTHVWRPQ